MRLRSLVAVAGTAIIGGALGILACGDKGVREGEDAGGAVEGGAREGSAPEDGEAAPNCDLTADLLAKVNDASIGDGASTTGLCLGCARARCEEAITACTEDCPCQRIVGNALECYVTTQQIGCAGALADIFVTRDTRRYALQLLGCVQSECADECVIEGGAVPSDAGTDADADAN